MYICVRVRSNKVTPLSPCNINSIYIETCVSVCLMGVDFIPQVVSVICLHISMYSYTYIST